MSALSGGSTRLQPTNRLKLRHLGFFPLLCLLAAPVTYAQEAGRTGVSTDRMRSEDRSLRSSPKIEYSMFNRRRDREPRLVLLGLGDSLTHGTMDATNNEVNTSHGYLQYVADSLEQTDVSLWFQQPFWDIDKTRMKPFVVPTNLAVDGADLFTVEGLQYYKRAGTDETYLDKELLCDAFLPRGLKSPYDKVLYPISVEAHQKVSQMDALIWSLNDLYESPELHGAVVVMWIGNNDSGSAALGGGSSPAQVPMPADLVESELTFGLRYLLKFGERTGEVAFEPFTITSIERNLTDLDDFTVQYQHLMDRIATEVMLDTPRMEIFVLTLPYYSAVGFLFDSEDLEFYLRKADPTYTIPPTFARVAPPGAPITDPLAGDRVAMVTFGMMYTLLWSGYSVDYVNQAVEIDGQQRDGLVLSQQEMEFVSARIDAYNDSIRNIVAQQGDHVHLLEAGQKLNEGLMGDVVVTVGDKVLGRKWTRGSGFCLDGVHPSYTVHALIANYVLENINAVMGTNAPMHDLETVLATDPYIDHDNDGWAPGPGYRPSGLTKVLRLFTDEDDSDPSVGVEFPRNVWRVVSNAFLFDMLGIPAIRAEAERVGIVPEEEE